MGVLNVTPDSFSDGGHYLAPSKALERAFQLADDGADIIDIGAESSRPGSAAVDVKDEWQRLEPLLCKLEKSNFSLPISVDTNKPEIMRRLPDFGVSLINDIKGGADPDTLAYLASRGVTYVAMHMHKDPMQMQIHPLRGDEAVAEVSKFYLETEEALRLAGFQDQQIWLDPGIGFGKDDAANLKLLRTCLMEVETRNILIGISRKSFLGRLLQLDNPMDRDPPSKILEMCFLFAGVKCVRTHDVKVLKEIRDLLDS